MTTILYRVLTYIKILLQQLWLSISSINFYRDVYKNYTGYGLKYIFTLSFMAALIYCSVIFNHIVELKNYFAKNEASKSTINIEYLIRQLPEAHYDGKNISIEEDTPLYLYNSDGQKIVAIDPNNKLLHAEKENVPIVLTSNRITILLNNKNHNNFSIDYTTLFGTQEQSLTQVSIKQQFAAIFSSMPSIFIYIFMPILIVLYFLSILFEQSFIVILVYSLSNIFGPKSSMKTCVRVVMFASGVNTLAHPIVIIFMPWAASSMWLIQLWSNVLLLLAMIKIAQSTTYNRLV